MSGIRGVAGKFAGIQQGGEIGGNTLGYAVCRERCGNVFLALLGHVQAQLVSHKAQQAAVKFLIEGRVQVLLQEFPGL